MGLTHIWENEYTTLTNSINNATQGLANRAPCTRNPQTAYTVPESALYPATVIRS